MQASISHPKSKITHSTKMTFNFSNNHFGIINTAMSVFAIPILISGALMGKAGITECGLTTDTDAIAIAVLIMVVSLAGFIGSYFRIKCLLWIYFVVMLILIISGLGFAILMSVISSKGSGESVPGVGYKEYKFGRYSKELQIMVNSTKNWNKNKACMVHSQICSNFNKKYLNFTVEKFQKAPLNAIQSGCCKPPHECGFTYHSPTNWTTENGVSGYPDCKAWDNSKDLCFNCQSCKAGMAANLKLAVRRVATVYMVFYMVLFIVYCFGNFAFNKMREENDWNKT